MTLDSLTVTTRLDNHSERVHIMERRGRKRKNKIKTPSFCFVNIITLTTHLKVHSHFLQHYSFFHSCMWKGISFLSVSRTLQQRSSLLPCPKSSSYIPKANQKKRRFFKIVIFPEGYFLSFYSPSPPF